MPAFFAAATTVNRIAALPVLRHERKARGVINPVRVLLARRNHAR